MPLIAYRTYRPKPETREIIDSAIEILEEYAAQGFSLTLRQLYYQFIARDLFPESYVSQEGTKNNIKSYNKLGDIITAAREGGMIDWNHITDRGRTSESKPHWLTAKHFIDSVAPQFNIDLWTMQPKRVEVWVEKDALSDVVARACRPLDIPYTACKGYMSVSAIWEAAHDRIRRHWNRSGQGTVILHLGDHDPSGIDMTRDIEDRLRTFSAQYGDHSDSDPCELQVIRIALTREQINQYNPPPNPAKETDSRFAAYQAVHGDESWELDALEPQVIVDLITRTARRHMNQARFRQAQQEEAGYRARLLKASHHWDRVIELLDELPDPEPEDQDDDDTEEE